jgi:hypothetical protein
VQFQRLDRHALLIEHEEFDHHFRQLVFLLLPSTEDSSVEINAWFELPE